MKQTNAPHNIHSLLKQAFIRIIAGMCIPILLLGGLLIALTQRYDAVIADTTSASALCGIIAQQLPDEIWRVVSGRISFDEGQQRTPKM